MATDEGPQERDLDFAPRSVFVDNDFDEGETFCRRLLECGEFTTDMLRKLVPKGHKGSSNVELARLVAAEVAYSDEAATRLMSAYCGQKRKWLHFRLGTCGAPPTMSSAREFLNKFGNADQWYGPFEYEGNPCYVRAKRVYHYHADGSLVRERRLRWHVVASVASDHISFHWNGFSINEDDENPKSAASSFPFWKHIPTFVGELERFLRSDWSLPQLGPIVLDDMWDFFRYNPSYKWVDKRIRAERHGVAIGAHSSAVSEIDITGIEALASALARSAVTSLGVVDAQSASKAQQAILRTLIKEFGPKSYELKIDRKGETSDPANDDEDTDDTPAGRRVFRAHCYFGGKPPEAGQDGFQHLNCWSNYGGSFGALAFLLPYAKQRALP